MTLPTLRRQLKRTTSRCPVCARPCPGEVWVDGGSPARVWLSRECPEHGVHDQCLASDARHYHLANGDPGNACDAGCACAADPDGRSGSLGRNAAKPGTPERLATCLALIEIVDSCNLACPTCFADSPVGAAGERLKFHPLGELQARIRGVLERKGGLEILQLSGGEPTLHPDFFELLEWIAAEPRIDYTLLNTNGLRLAREPRFLARLGQHARRGRFQLYLQFDGPGVGGQRELRGADLRALKRDAIAGCERERIPFTLAMTVTPANLDQVWQTVDFGLRFERCRGVSFQPMFGSGRVGTDGERKINPAELLQALFDRSGGRLAARDFTPLPCGDPNCATIGYLLRTPLGTRSLADFIDFAELQGFLRDKVRYQLDDLVQCGCENTELGELLRRYELEESAAFRLFIKPFMDEHDWDEDRIDRCCTHVIRPDGRLDSFCRYYARRGPPSGEK